MLYFEPGKPKEKSIRKEDAKSKNNVAKKVRKHNGVLMEHMIDKYIEEKVLEDTKKDPVPRGTCLNISKTTLLWWSDNSHASCY